MVHPPLAPLDTSSATFNSLRLLPAKELGTMQVFVAGRSLGSRGRVISPLEQKVDTLPKANIERARSPEKAKGVPRPVVKVCLVFKGRFWVLVILCKTVCYALTMKPLLLIQSYVPMIGQLCPNTMPTKNQLNNSFSILSGCSSQRLRALSSSLGPGNPSEHTSDVRTGMSHHNSSHG